MFAENFLYQLGLLNNLYDYLVDHTILYLHYNLKSFNLMEQNFILITYPYDLALIRTDILIIISVIAFIFANCIAIVHYINF